MSKNISKKILIKLKVKRKCKEFKWQGLNQGEAAEETETFDGT